MKKQSILSGIKTMLGVASRYCRQHAASLAAMQKVYVKPWPGDTASEGYTLVAIRIIPFESVYKVSQSYYLNGELQHEKSWIATYGWHSNGHLIEIGGDRYCIFNPAGKELFLEYHDENIDKVMEVYKEI